MHIDPTTASYQYPIRIEQVEIACDFTLQVLCTKIAIDLREVSSGDSVEGGVVSTPDKSCGLSRGDGKLLPIDNGSLGLLIDLKKVSAWIAESCTS